MGADLGDAYVCAHSGLLPKVHGGKVPQDSGKVSSYIGQVVKAAGVMPGPGKYDIPDLLGGDARKSVFPKGSREEKYHKKNSPEPCTYDQFQTAHLPRTLGGRWSRGGKVTFIDLAAKKVNRGPGPEKYNPKEVLGHIQSREFQIRKSETRIDENNSSRKMPGPGKYDVLHRGSEDRVLTFSLGRKHKSLGETEAAARSGMPGPGQYPLTNINKTSRATMLLQIGGYERNALTGFF